MLIFNQGNPMPSYKVKPGKLTDFGRITFSKFMQPLEDAECLRKGKKPCARDGHKGLSKYFYKNHSNLKIVVKGNQLIIFAGDRHKMSFNDIYKLDLQDVLEKIN